MDLDFNRRKAWRIGLGMTTIFTSLFLTSCTSSVHEAATIMTDEEALALGVGWAIDFESFDPADVAVLAGVYPQRSGEDFLSIGRADTYVPRQMSDEERRRYMERGIAICEVGQIYPCDDMESLGRNVLIIGGIPSRGAFPIEHNVLVPVLYMSTTEDYWARMMLVDFDWAPTGAAREWFSEN